MNSNWLKKYLDQYKESIFNNDVMDGLVELQSLLEEANLNGKKTMLMGNGASASIASHVSVDLSKAAGIRATCFNESNLITCLANDYGYEYWMAKAIEIYHDKGDNVILISSSGTSPNVLKAGQIAKKNNLNVITFSGFDAGNPLRAIGDLNFWVDSRAYNIVENTHQIWLLSVCDAIIGSAEYSAS